MVDVVFIRPLYLWFLLSIPLMIISHFYLVHHTKLKGLKFANFEALRRVSGEKIISKDTPKMFLRVSVLLFLVCSAAGAQLWYSGFSNDFNFVLAVDASGSMLLDDLKPSRLDAAKESALTFVDSLSSEARIGVVSFSGAAYIEQRLTEKKKEVKNSISDINLKETQGTAIGDAVLTSINLLLSEEQARVLILLTDGQENVLEKSDLDTIIAYAQEEHITIYTIGVGTPEGSLSILPESVRAELAAYNVSFSLDEATLQNIALETGGEYYRAANKEGIQAAYTQIASHQKPTQLKRDLSYGLLVVGLLLLFVEWGLINTRYKLIHFEE